MYSMTSLQEVEHRRQVAKDIIIQIHGTVAALGRLAKVVKAAAIGQKVEGHKELAAVAVAAFTVVAAVAL